MIIDQQCQVLYDFFWICLSSHCAIVGLIGLVYILNKRNLVLNTFVVDTIQQSIKVCRIIEKDCSEIRVVGIDAEWVTLEKTRQPVALLQLCTPQGTCALFRLNKLKCVPQQLQKLLENEEIIKVGVVPEKDASLLYSDYGVYTKNTLDLRFLYSTHVGLAALSKEILNITLDKNYKIRCSNWEASELDERQVHYAAMDAYVAVEIFKKWAGINRSKFKANPEWCLIKGAVEDYLNQICSAKAPRISNGKDTSKNSGKKLIDQSWLNRFSIKKEKIYDNCYMRAPDGTLLCTLRKSKAQWYLNREKAELISEDPYTIRLLFEPKKKPTETEHLYEKELKSDLCVVCGSTLDLLKHCVVPRMYSKHFPISMKSHCSHDILLFCVKCHLEASDRDRTLMQRLEQAAGYEKRNNKITETSSVKGLGNFARALLKHSASIPETRRNEMVEEIRKKYSVEEVTAELLMAVANEKVVTSESETPSTGQIIVEYFSTGGRSLFDLQRQWRKHFVSTMHPKYLPKHWSVNHEN